MVISTPEVSWETGYNPYGYRFEAAWKNFFYRRDATDAHPMAQEIAKPMHQKFIELTKIE